MEKTVATLHNSHRYLQPILINQCFTKGKVNHVDKIICGNGFTTGFLSITPTENKINIIIAPNKAVILEKQKAYNQGANSNLRMKFFYKESTDKDFKGADVLFFVADSFLMMKSKLNEIKHKIDKVLIDEFHSVEIQSLFRRNLIDFEYKVKNICSDSDTSIVTVTASPNIFSKVDIRIYNSIINNTTINISKDREKTIERIKTDLKNDEKVIVLTNSASAIYKLENYNRRKKTRCIEGRFIVGSSLTRSLVEMAEIKHNEQSNLTVISAKGFEGFDVYYENAKVYFLEDRSNDHETFFIANLYQAINRNRESIKYIEYNRLELSNTRKKAFKNINLEIDKFINCKKDSIAGKQKKEYKKYHPFVITTQDLSGVFSIKKNIVAIQLYKERLLFDKPFFKRDFKEFLEDRNITINFLNETNNRLKTKMKNETKIKNLLSNAALIDSLDLFGRDYKLEVVDKTQKVNATSEENRLLYLKHLNKYLRCKNYKGNRIQTAREIIASRLLNSEIELNLLVSEVTKAYDVRSIDKYGFKGSLEYRERFKKQGHNTTCKLILMFVNENINLYQKWVANRDYNILTEIGISELEIVAKVFNVSVKEIDINSCFARILYAINGLELPSDFYGKDKENKLKINIFLNDFFYDKEQKTPKKGQKRKAILKFRKLGFDEKVISYLINNFFESEYRGDLFNKLTFYEKQLITEIKDLISNDMNQGDNNIGAIRRHDSLIIFNNKSDLSYLNDFSFMNVHGWFNVNSTKVVNFEDYVIGNFKENRETCIEEYSEYRLMSL